ncbi:hypothetical protein [Mucilaginibacter sp.]
MATISNVSVCLALFEIVFHVKRYTYTAAANRFEIKKSITFFFLVPASAKLFSNEKKDKKESKRSMGVQEQHKCYKVASAIIVARAQPDISFAFIFIVLFLKQFPLLPCLLPVQLMWSWAR